MSPFPPHFRGDTTCALRAYGVVEATSTELAALRKQPGPPGGPPLSPTLLNHAEDQTVAAVAAVLHAVEQHGLQDEDFTNWAIVGAPRYAGRVSFATALDKFAKHGSISVSPLIVPFLCSHSHASMISLALRSRGPSVAVGGAGDGFAQALLMAMTLRQEKNLRGIWVVATGWDPEIVPGVEMEKEPVCRAAALALLPVAAGATGSHLRMVPRKAGKKKPNLTDMIHFLTDTTARNWRCPLSEDCDLELTVDRADYSLLARSA